jgi:hypothetical protein
VAKLAGVTSEEFSNVRRQWFGFVYEIADIDYQRERGSRHRTTVRTGHMWNCCSYPDADQLRSALDRGHLSFKQFELLAALDKAIISHRAIDDYDNRAILEDPSWHAVVAKAEQIHQQLLAITEDLSRKAI